MRLSTQISFGQAGSVFAIVVLGALGIGLVDRHSRTTEQVLNEGLALVEAGRKIEGGFRDLLAGRSPPAAAEAQIRSALEAAARSTVEPSIRQSLERLGSATSWTAGDRASLERAEALAVGLVGAGLDSSRRTLETARALGRSGVGLISVTAVAGLLLALYFGYWIARHVTQPLERIGRGLDQVAAGDLARRFPHDVGSDAVSEISLGLNVILDRLQRAETQPRTDLLLVSSAVERLFDGETRACGVLAGGHRLLASNEIARRLILEKNTSFQWLTAAARRLSPQRVETRELLGPAGDRLGEIIFFPPGAVGAGVE